MDIVPTWSLMEGTHGLVYFAKPIGWCTRCLLFKLKLKNKLRVKRQTESCLIFALKKLKCFKDGCSLIFHSFERFFRKQLKISKLIDFLTQLDECRVVCIWICIIYFQSTFLICPEKVFVLNTNKKTFKHTWKSLPDQIRYEGLYIGTFLL